jgi:hypothetical protein
MRRLCAILLTILALPIIPTNATAADTIQAIGPIVAIRENHSTADSHASYHGRIFVGDSIGGYAEYRWGGSSCPGLVLPPELVAQLQRGFNNPRIMIEPYTKQGQGSACLVGFTLVLRSDLGALP